MRQWPMVLAIVAATCGKAEAETARAGFAVSVTVIDQCIVRPAIRSATCTGGAGFDVGVAREELVLPAGGRLTGIGEHAHTSVDGPLIATSPSAVGQSAADGQGAGLAAIDDRSVAPGLDRIEAIRVTYSF